MTIDIDIARCRLPPFAHQRADTATLVSEPPYLFITSEMRTGKTKIVIDGAQILFELNKIDTVIVVAPAPVRDVWCDPDLGELRKHLWLDLPARVVEYHARIKGWNWGPVGTAKRVLQWIVTNYEYIRSGDRLDELMPFASSRTLIVGDESSLLKNAEAQQTKAFRTLRWQCGRVVLLNGTPISHSPRDLFSQGNLLHPSILDCRYITHYLARYAQQQTVTSKRTGKAIETPRGREVKQVIGWINLDDIQRRFAPHTIRRMQKDCLDLPPKLDAVTLTADLTPATWKIYKQMRDELVVWLKDNTVATAQQAAVKSLRLAQITSGFLGGIEDAGIDEAAVMPGFLESLDLGEPQSESAPTGDSEPQRGSVPKDISESIATSAPHGLSDIREIGREKLDVLLWFLRQQLDADPQFHGVAWCRFRPELFRMVREVAATFPEMTVGSLHGDQKKTERQEAIRLLHPSTSPPGPVFVAGTYGTGSFGLNFTAANTSINCSFDFSLGKFLQASDRVYGPGQTKPVAYFDLVARGPKGQKTIDHHIVQARRNNEDLATWTTAAWITALTSE
jgi:SNF2 family DNA or RNA helicase